MPYGSTSPSEQARVAAWWRRIKAAQEVYEDRRPIWDTLEDAVSGRFPPLMSKTGHAALGLVNDQCNLNLMLRTKRLFEANWDELPSLRYSRQPSMDEEAVVADERLMEQLGDEGGAAYESRRAMGYSMTRGSWAVRLYAERDRMGEAEMAAARLNPSELTDAVMRGEEWKIPVGADYQGIAEAAIGILETPDLGATLLPYQTQGLQALYEEATKLHAKEMTGPKTVDGTAKIKFEALPYGPWLLFPADVTDRKRMGWIAIGMVMTPDEFVREKSFKASVRREVRERYEDALKDKDGHVAGDSSKTRGPSDPPVDEQNRIKVWRIEDRINQKRHYLTEVCKDEFLEVDDTYEFLDENGEALFRNYFSVVIRTPLEANKEEPWRMLGIPVLEPGWPMQVEFIKFRTAEYASAKKTARIGTLSPGVSEQFAQKIADAQDGDFTRLDANYDQTKHGDPIRPIIWGPAPKDYQVASKQSMFDFATAVGVSLTGLTGEPVADTLGQEQLAVAGTNMTQADMVRQYESGWAELMENAGRLFRKAASPIEFASYLGQASILPRRKDDGTELPSIYEVMRATPLTGCKLTARFASGTRAEDAVKIKQIQDFIALNGTVLEPITKQPYFDQRPMVQRLAKMQDMEGLVPNPAIAAMKAHLAQQAEMQAQQQGMGGPGKAGADETSRKANGERGPQAIPGRQDRNERPGSAQQKTGVANRAATSLA